MAFQGRSVRRRRVCTVIGDMLTCKKRGLESGQRRGVGWVDRPTGLRSLLTTADDGGRFVFGVWVKTHVAYSVCTRDEHVLASSCQRPA